MENYHLQIHGCWVTNYFDLNFLIILSRLDFYHIKLTVEGPGDGRPLGGGFLLKFRFK